jgi:hypothetical protein
VRQLITENGTRYDQLDRYTLTSAVSALNTGDNTFATMEREDGSILQIAYNGPQGYYVEIQDAASSKLFRNKLNHSCVEDVVRTATTFRDHIAPSPESEWLVSAIPKSNPRFRVFKMLNWAGLLLALISFVLLLKDQNNIYSVKLVFAAMWLMFPCTLQDTIDVVNTIRRKSLPGTEGEFYFKVHHMR